MLLLTNNPIIHYKRQKKFKRECFPVAKRANFPFQIFFAFSYSVMASTLLESTTSSRVGAKNDDYFKECIKVKFEDESGKYRYVDFYKIFKLVF
jgi:hypothetical protein